MSTATNTSTYQPLSRGEAAPRPLWASFYQLTKPGITRLVLFTAAVGFYLASRSPLDVGLFLHTLFGTGLASASANALNQYVERDVDALMKRTRNRPLPSGRVAPHHALAFAVAIGAVAVVDLLLFVNVTAALLVLSSILLYVLAYTPLKRRTSLSTLVGAVPGALPIVAGWAAAGGSLGAEAWVLFGILFLWQVPHTLALAWLFRDDYLAGGFRMLSADDVDGRATGRQIVLYTLGLVPTSLALTAYGVTGMIYFWGALLLGLGFLGIGLAWAVRPGGRRARRLFFASVIYLPALLLLMVIDKLPA